MDGRYVIPILVVVLGIAWLLNSLDVFPALDWIWTIGMGTMGILVLATGGAKKESVVVGPTLIAASISSIFRQTEHLKLKAEIPILVIVLGIMLLIAEIMHLPSNKSKHLDNE